MMNCAVPSRTRGSEGWWGSHDGKGYPVTARDMTKRERQRYTKLNP